MLASHTALRRNPKFLSTGNLTRQQAAENTMKRQQIGLQKAIVTAKNDFIRECAAAYRSHKERDFTASSSRIGWRSSCCSSSRRSASS